MWLNVIACKIVEKNSLKKPVGRQFKAHPSANRRPTVNNLSVSDQKQYHRITVQTSAQTEV